MKELQSLNKYKHYWIATVYFCPVLYNGEPQCASVSRLKHSDCRWPLQPFTGRTLISPAGWQKYSPGSKWASPCRPSITVKSYHARLRHTGAKNTSAFQFLDTNRGEPAATWRHQAQKIVSEAVALPEHLYVVDSLQGESWEDSQSLQNRWAKLSRRDKADHGAAVLYLVEKVKKWKDAEDVASSVLPQER